MPGLAQALPGLGGKGRWAIGTAHELIRLANLGLPDVVLTAVEKKVPIVGRHAGLSFDATLEIDGVTTNGKALEVKLATSGLNYLTSAESRQAAKYGLAVKRGWLSQVRYHVTAPTISQTVVGALRQVIPALRIFRYDSVFLPKSAEINSQISAVY